MPIAADPMLRPQPSSNQDGLDLTVEEARALSPELFRRTFGFDGLGDVPTVGPGFLPKRPKGGEWYLRFRPAPANPKPKDRKVDSWELVVMAPPQAPAGAGAGAGRKVYGLAAKEPDAARLEALVFLARKSGRRIRATNWSIDRIQSLLVRDVLETYANVYLVDPSAEEKASKVDSTRSSYLSGVRAFQKAFPDLEVGDIGDWIPLKYAVRASHRTQQTRQTDMHAAKRGVRLGLRHLGVVGYDSGWRIPDIGMLPKVAWTPDQYDRLMAAADGYVFGAGGAPEMVSDGKGGMVQKRRGDYSRRYRAVWLRGIPFLTWMVTRSGRLTTTRWLPPEIEPSDGRPLPPDDRPWIEIADDAVYYHRDGESRYDGNKRRGGNVVPKEFENEVRAWYEQDAAKGWEWVFHKPRGGRYSEHVGKSLFSSIVEDAGLDMRRVPHHLKDLAVQISDEAGVPREALAAHADTTTQVLAAKYGEPNREALKQRAADGMTQTDWRARAARKAEVARRFAEGRARPAPDPDAAGTKAPAGKPPPRLRLVER